MHSILFYQQNDFQNTAVKYNRHFIISPRFILPISNCILVGGQMIIDIMVFIINMDTKVKEQITENADGSYSIFLNAKLSQDQYANKDICFIILI